MVSLITLFLAVLPLIKKEINEQLKVVVVFLAIILIPLQWYLVYKQNSENIELKQYLENINLSVNAIDYDKTLLKIKLKSDKNKNDFKVEAAASEMVVLSLSKSKLLSDEIQIIKDAIEKAEIEKGFYILPENLVKKLFYFRFKDGKYYLDDAKKSNISHIYYIFDNRNYIEREDSINIQFKIGGIYPSPPIFKSFNDLNNSIVLTKVIIVNRDSLPTLVEFDWFHNSKISKNTNILLKIIAKSENYLNVPERYIGIYFPEKYFDLYK